MSVKQYYDTLTAAQIQEYKASNKFLWLSLFPSLGYNFIQNTPVVSLDLSGIGSFCKAKEDKKYKIESIKKINDIDLSDIILEIRSSYSSINHLIEKFKIDKLIFEKKSELFQIYQKKYSNNEIKLEDFLLLEIEFLSSKKNLDDKQYLIICKLNDLQLLSHIQLVYKL